MSQTASNLGVMGARMDMLEEEVERCSLKTLEAILKNSDHPLYNTFMENKDISVGRHSIICATATKRFRADLA